MLGEFGEPPTNPTATERTKLLDERLSKIQGETFQFPAAHNCGEENCNHGTFSPRPRYLPGYGSFAGTSGTPTGPAVDARSERSLDLGGPPGANGGHSSHASIDGVLGKPSNSRRTTRWLAQVHGIENKGYMYLAYYFPFFRWITQYRWKYLEGDLTAALTMASFYIPMALSLASNLAHVPPINGLYAFVFNPLVYALLGTSPLMVVGPEAAGSLLTGGVVKESIKAGTHGENQGVKLAQVAGMVTALAGAFILVAGLCRLGFLDGVLSRPFLRGFISAIGITILVDQMIPEMGLDTAAAHSQAAKHGSSLDKIMFLFRHGHEAHRLTCAVAFSTIAIVLVLRELKRRLQPRMHWVAYVPDRFLVVVLSAVMAWGFGWEGQGLQVMGDIRSRGTPFKAHFPFDESNFKHVNDAFSSAFIIALLGFFESSVAAKSLGNAQPRTKTTTDENGDEVEEADGIRGVHLSTNRELVALGVANLIGGLFMAVPAFGGYGRSKVNASTGGKTPMSSVFLALITLICVLFLLPYFYYIPVSCFPNTTRCMPLTLPLQKATLSALITVVAISLIEEAPHDIRFFFAIGGYSELFLMTLIFITTFLWNLKIGIAVGIGLSLLRVVKHSTRPRIQILGRVPGTKEFENAELFGAGMGGVEGQDGGVEMVPHCLIVKIPEPLTFANTGSLKDRLRRLEDHGTGSAHPALPKIRNPKHNQNVIFDVHGVTTLDPAAAQVLLEIVESYVERGTRVFFCRVPGRRSEVWRLMNVSGIVELCGGEKNFLRSVDDALQATERESTLHSERESLLLAGDGPAAAEEGFLGLGLRDESFGPPVRTEPERMSSASASAAGGKIGGEGSTAR